MSRIVHVNGDWVAEEDAKISVFDRGLLFADAVYEVVSVLHGRLVDFTGHVRRLERSLAELSIPMPCTVEELLALHREIVRRNALEEGLIYLQVTRGSADRDFGWPEGMTPNVIMFTQEKRILESPAAGKGLKVMTLPDIRWGRRDIKTTQLLAASLAKMAAKAEGKDDAWLVEDGYVTEGSSNNAYIVTRDGVIVTRALSEAILAGITRAAVLRLAEEAQMRIEERSFTPEEAKDATEAFVTSASAFVMPVVEIDGVRVGSGEPGPIAKRLREIYTETSLGALE